MSRIRNTAFVLGTVSTLALASAAFAQNPPAKATDEATVVDEFVVTSQKREENVKDVPVSINVVGEAQIERQQIYNVYDLSRTTPALELTNAAGQFPGGGGQIRGIGTQTFGVGAVGSVGIVVDGVSQGNVNITDLFDIQRIEVLKGPQGTLFGLTTSAGVINIVTQQPNFRDFSLKARTELSQEGTAGSTGYGQQIFATALNLPLTSNAAMRISTNINLRQGPGRNALDGSLDDHDTHSLRARLLWRPTEKLDLNFNGDYSQNHGDGPDFFTVFKSTIPSFVTQLANCRLNPSTPITPVVPSTGNRDYCTTTRIEDGSTIYGGSVSADYRMEPFTITSITAARRSRTADDSSLDIFRLRNAFFLTPIPVPPFVSNSGFVGSPSDIQGAGAPRGGYTDLVTQEIRIASPTGSMIEYTLGGFYSNQTSHNYGGNTFTLRDYTSPGGPGFIVNGVPLPGGPSTTADFSSAIFGQATWHLNDKFALIAGGRYTDETLRQNSTSSTGVVTKSQGDITNTSYRFGAQYKFDDTLQTYATYARGYKGPQFAAVAGAPAGTPLRVVLPEEPENYEIGAKKTMFGGRAILDLSAFYTKVKNYQGQVCAVNPATLILGCTIDNFDGVISKGVEANLFGRVSDHFTVSTGIIYNPATYPKKATVAGVSGPFLAAAGVLADGSAIVNNLSGEQLVNAPLWKATFSGEYSHDFNTKYQGFVSADAVYRSEIRLGASLDPELIYPNSWVFGGRLGVRSMQGWTGALFVRNAGDEHIPTLRQAAFPASQAGVGNSYGQFLNTASFRVVGLTLELNY